MYSLQKIQYKLVDLIWLFLLYPMTTVSLVVPAVPNDHCQGYV